HGTTNAAGAYGIVRWGAPTAAGTTVTNTSSGANPIPKLMITGANNTGFSGTLANSGNGIVYLAATNALARTAAVSTGTSAASGVFVGIPAGVLPQFPTDTGFTVQLGSVAGTGSFQLGTATAASAALVGFDGTNTTLNGQL